MSSNNIPPAPDTVGRIVCWRPNKYSDKIFGEVIKLWYDIGADPRYPVGSKGYKNGIRALFKKMKVRTADDREFTLSAEWEDMKAIGMVAETSYEEG